MLHAHAIADRRLRIYRFDLDDLLRIGQRLDLQSLHVIGLNLNAQPPLPVGAILLECHYRPELRQFEVCAAHESFERVAQNAAIPLACVAYAELEEIALVPAGEPGLWREARRRLPAVAAAAV